MKKLLLFLVLVGLGLAGLAYWLSGPSTPPIARQTFTYATAGRGPMRETVSATGLMQPREVVVVGSELPGTVVELVGKINDVVSEGDVLLRLDDRRLHLKWQEAVVGVATAEAAVAQARAMETAATKAVQYQKELEGKGGFRWERDQAEAQLEAARAGVQVAEAKLQSAKTMQQEAQLALDMAVVKVPVRKGAAASGAGGKRQYLILDRKVQRGQIVGPPSPVPLFTLAGDLAQVEVHTEVAEGDIGRVRQGLKAVFTVAAYWEPDAVFEGTVKEIRPLPTSVKGAVFYNAVIDVANQKDSRTEEWRLRPGMTASVDIVIRQRKDVWKMPTAALNFQLDEAYQSEAAKARLARWRERPDRDEWKAVWVWDEARAIPWPVFVRIGGLKAGETGMKDGEYNEVLEWEPGLEPAASGLRVITAAPPARRPGLFEQPANFKVS